MDFRAYVRSIVGHNLIGVEFGPSYNPILAKKDGYNVFVVDHADEEALREKYRPHGVDVDRIEPVDAIDDGGELTKLLPPGMKFDYIVASHVFEHLPDPIGFLQRCERALKPDGKLFLMVPDRRFTFDYFRPVSTTGDMLRAYLEGRTRHDPGNLFDHLALSTLRDGAFIWADRNDGAFALTGTAQAGYAAAVASQDAYVDCHAWVFVPSSFRLIVDDLRAAGLTQLGELEFHDSIGCEFFVVLSPAAPPPPLTRIELARNILAEAGAVGPGRAVPPVPQEQPAFALKEAYEPRAPSAQNAVDVMAGSWVAAIPDSFAAQAGDIPLSADARIAWLIEQIGGVSGLDILELGPLEASHTAMLLEAGANSVLAIEANRLAFLKCLIVKEVRRLAGASFLLGDFTKFLETDTRRWPLIVACGVLYHMEEPLRLLEQLAARTDQLFLWTHVVDDIQMPEGDPRREPIRAVEERTWRGRAVRHYLRPYQGKNDPKFCGGIPAEPAWLDRGDLLDALAALGFDDVRTIDHDQNVTAGPSTTILARRTASAA
ncbi:methyltransferase domain-containing protein [Xanthobacter pseudotagetidis]|uniref:methyltransferase domain-containing protein n=1 Tax=Xanthobacter pseudotagetidis TaxID=3119911 RepID=UPI00372BFB03